mmetsp:Transcript_556/g.1767  ORF Transcript_556/g.1767 Transcript_556/m.1767 type:complete len:267 (-) Transcript_556:386-1186(-)
MVCTAILQDVPDDILAEKILRQPCGVLDDPLDNLGHLSQFAVLQQPLDYAAAIHVRGDFGRLCLYRANDERARLRRHDVDDLLDDVVAVHALDARHHVLLHRPGHAHEVLGGREVHRLLHDAAAVRVVGDVQHDRHQCTHQKPLLLRVTDVEQHHQDLAAAHVASEVPDHLQQVRHDRGPSRRGLDVLEQLHQGHVVLATRVKRFAPFDRRVTLTFFLAVGLHLFASCRALGTHHRGASDFAHGQARAGASPVVVGAGATVRPSPE